MARPRVEPILAAGDPFFVEMTCGRFEVRLVGQIGECLTPPQCQCFAEVSRRSAHVAARLRGAAGREQPVEPGRVEIVGTECE